MSTVCPVCPLDMFSLAECCSAAADQPLTLDLRRTTFISPAGLVFFGVSIGGPATRGRAFVPRPAPNAKATRSIEHWGLGDNISRCATSGEVLPVVPHHPPADRFLELTRFAATGD